MAFGATITIYLNLLKQQTPHLKNPKYCQELLYFTQAKNAPLIKTASQSISVLPYFGSINASPRSQDKRLWLTSRMKSLPQ